MQYHRGPPVADLRSIVFYSDLICSQDRKKRSSYIVLEAALQVRTEQFASTGDPAQKSLIGGSSVCDTYATLDIFILMRSAA